MTDYMTWRELEQRTGLPVQTLRRVVRASHVTCKHDARGHIIAISQADFELKNAAWLDVPDLEWISLHEAMRRTGFTDQWLHTLSKRGELQRKLFRGDSWWHQPTLERYLVLRARHYNSPARTRPDAMPPQR